MYQIDISNPYYSEYVESLKPDNDSWNRVPKLRDLVANHPKTIKEFRIHKTGLTRKRLQDIWFICLECQNYFDFLGNSLAGNMTRIDFDVEVSEQEAYQIVKKALKRADSDAEYRKVVFAHIRHVNTLVRQKPNFFTKTVREIIAGVKS